MARAAELVEAARALTAAGRWEQADLLLSTQRDHPDAAYALAETAVDAAFWRRGSARGAAHARAADRLLEVAQRRRGAADVPTRLLVLRRRYHGLLFGGPDRAAAEELAADLAGLAAQTCTDCDPTPGWNAFYLAICYDNLLADPHRAAPLYREAQEQARLRGDRLAESYPMRHLAAQAHAAGRLEEALDLAYRALALRQAVGAAPAVAAQQVFVVRIELFAGGENRALRAMVDGALETARALDIPFVAEAGAALRQALRAAV